MKKLIVTLVIAASTLLPVAAAPDSSEEISERLQVADSLHSIGRTDSAAIVGEGTIKLAHEYGDPSLIVGAHAAQGVFLRSLGRVDEALENYDAALAIVTSGQFRENPDQEAIEQIASLYINLSVLNLDMQHKDEAAKNAELSGEWIAKSEDPELRSVIYGVVGSVLTGCNALDKALEYQKKAYDDALASENSEAAFRAAAYTMLIADRLGDKAEAQAQRERCEKLMPEIESMTARMAYYQAECSICLKNDDPKGAIVWFERILSLDGIDNFPFVKFDCYNNMHIAQAGMGDYAGAYATLLESNELRDSLWEEEKAESLRDLTVKYETKETQLALAQSEAKRARTLMWLFAAIGLLLIGVTVFVVYANRQRRRRMEREVEFANLRADIGRQLTRQYVEGLENERRRMSSELHDGVCNDLLAIEMNITGGKPIESTASLIQQCRESVRRISHELMPPEFAYASIDEVVRYFVAKQAEAAGGKITFGYESESEGTSWQDVPDATSLEVYRIVQEAVGNAVKHSGADAINVAMTLAGDTLTAVVADNGQFKIQPGRKGIGMESIQRRAAAIGGTVTVDREAEDGGTKVTLKVKI